MTYLKKIYINWSARIEDFSVEWCDSFNEQVNIDEKEFGLLIKKYISTCKNPPNSPFDLVNVIEDYEDKFRAWEKVYDTLMNTTDDMFFKQSIKKNYPELYEFVKSWNTDKHREEHDSFGNKVFGFYYYKRFITDYDEYIKSKKLVKINGEIQSCINSLMQLQPTESKENGGFTEL